eukprot:TRINITY_DN30590_c0_g2_i2.p1 TRINITY_DN30590_c0_g2~~TRINITY_DN30590_c0_g2_i2.p1  ORF type:complete len:460 (-),score=110.25 TRINITY_DN30590_c0_g2_i2:127-1506(-)
MWVDKWAENLITPLESKEHHGQQNINMLWLSENISGHSVCVKDFCRRLTLHRRWKSERPMVVMIFGRPGTGKTEFAKQISQALKRADPEVELIHVNLGQFKGKQAFSQLQGATPGHKGYGDVTPLHSLLSFPKSLVLLDELDKAEPDIIDFFLNAFNDGYLRTADGKLVSCKDAIFVITANLWGSLVQKKDVIFKRWDDLLRAPKFAADAEFQRNFLSSPNAAPFVDRIQIFYGFSPFSRAELLDILEQRMVQLSMKCKSLFVLPDSQQPSFLLVWESLFSHFYVEWFFASLEEENKSESSSFSIRSFLRDFESQVQDECNLIFDTFDSASQQTLILALWDGVGKKIKCTTRHDSQLDTLVSAVERREAALEASASSIGVSSAVSDRQIPMTAPSDDSVSRSFKELESRLARFDDKLLKQQEKMTKTLQTTFNPSSWLLLMCLSLLVLNLAIMLKQNLR